ncbi:hypothetical protein IJG29_03800 [Candidatus Saccharibacteria bacterium]|nr:hypothetical protein [Candidatus Saccharibacteria bacterium]
MLVPISEKENESTKVPEDKKRAWNDLLKNANTGMMSWAEKNYKQKLIDILYQMDYYKYNQTIYVKPPKGDN